MVWTTKFVRDTVFYAELGQYYVKKTDILCLIPRLGRNILADPFCYVQKAEVR